MVVVITYQFALFLQLPSSSGAYPTRLERTAAEISSVSYVEPLSVSQSTLYQELPTLIQTTS